MTRMRHRIVALSAAFGLGGLAVPVTNLVLDRLGSRCPVDRHYQDRPTRGLQPAAADAWHAARQAAEEDGVTLCLNDGARTAAQQQAEFDEYRRRLGSAAAASGYVLPPSRSMHVRGLAVDVQPRGSAAWLEDSAGHYGWCRRYANEPWHFEYDPRYTAGCPPLAPHP